MVNDAIRFVSQQSRQNLKSSSSNEGDKEESNEPDYDEDKDQLEDEQGEKTREFISTTNHKSYSNSHCSCLVS